MFRLKFWVSWLLCSVLMYGLSYIWHGMVLNDYERLWDVPTLFFVFSALVYLGIGLMITLAVQYVESGMSFGLKGLTFGAGIGAFMFMVAFVLGLTFTSGPDLIHLATDFGWQVAEQAVGGWFCGLAFSLLAHREEALANQYPE